MVLKPIAHRAPDRHAVADMPADHKKRAIAEPALKAARHPLDQMEAPHLRIRKEVELALLAPDVNMSAREARLHAIAASPTPEATTLDGLKTLEYRGFRFHRHAWYSHAPIDPSQVMHRTGRNKAVMASVLNPYGKPETLASRAELEDYVERQLAAVAKRDAAETHARTHPPQTPEAHEALRVGLINIVSQYIFPSEGIEAFVNAIAKGDARKYGNTRISSLSGLHVLCIQEGWVAV